MEITIEENETINIPPEDDVNEFRKKWGNPRDTNSVQEITLQHLESEPTKKMGRPSLVEHTKIANDFRKITYKEIEKEINDCYLDENHNFSSSLDISHVTSNIYFGKCVCINTSNRMYNLGRNHYISNERIFSFFTGFSQLLKAGCFFRSSQNLITSI